MCLHYRVTDLDRMQTILTDFGLQRAVRTERDLLTDGTPVGHAEISLDEPSLDEPSRWARPLTPEFMG